MSDLTNYGDIRQLFDEWLIRAKLHDRAEWAIKDVQDAFDKLAEFVPAETTEEGA